MNACHLKTHSLRPGLSRMRAQDQDRLTVLVTGGAGSLGSHIVSQLANNGHTVRVFDQNEAALADMVRFEHDGARLICGSVVDASQVRRAAHGVDVVIHTAAVKNLDISEYNIDRLLSVNVTGTMNVASACAEECVPIAIFISSDKAVNPVNAYGASKLLGEHIWRWSHWLHPHTCYVTYRGPNFRPSRGSVFEIWERQHENGDPLTLTNPEMSRYFIDIITAARQICSLPGLIHPQNEGAINRTKKPPRACPYSLPGLYNINNGGVVRSGDIIIPRVTRQNMLQMLLDTYPGSQYQVTGIRAGEKLSESMVHESERSRCRKITDELCAISACDPPFRTES